MNYISTFPSIIVVFPGQNLCANSSHFPQYEGSQPPKEDKKAGTVSTKVLSCSYVKR